MEVRIAILGAGHLGEAGIEGLLRSGVPASSIQATARPASRAAALASTYGIRATADNAHAASRAMTVLLAVPPQAVAAVVEEIAPKLRDDAVVVSLAAGVPIARIEELLRPDTPVVRAMTNTASTRARCRSRRRSPGRARRWSTTSPRP
jgi:pyrroline-5-carboxylate reductase